MGGLLISTLAAFLHFAAATDRCVWTKQTWQFPEPEDREWKAGNVYMIKGVTWMAETNTADFALYIIKENGRREPCAEFKKGTLKPDASGWIYANCPMEERGKAGSVTGQLKTCGPDKKLWLNGRMVCPENHFAEGGVCKKITCSAGQVLNRGKCEAITCSAGQVLKRGRCEAIKCAAGQKLIGNKCKAIKTCQSKRSREYTACEFRRLSMSCPRGAVMKIEYASYGRHNRGTCRRGLIRNTRCNARSSMRKVREYCENKNRCSVRARNSVFGDPCRGTFKYLKVRARCGCPSGAGRSSACRAQKRGVTCEHRKLSLRCPSGKRLRILNASYGRKNRRNCSRGPIRTTNCHARSSLSKVRRSCQNKRSCTVRAKNSVFGDPCRGTRKYLEVNYKCC